MNQAEHDAHLRSGVIVGVAAYLFWGFATLYWHELDHFDAFELIGCGRSAACRLAIGTPHPQTPSAKAERPSWMPLDR